MLERNRTFGRVSRPVDKASAPRQALERQRKAGRARNAALIQPKPQPARLRETTANAATIPPAFLVDVEALQAAITAEPVPTSAEQPVTVEPVDRPAASPDDGSEPFPEAPSIVIDPAERPMAAAPTAPPLSVAMDPSARPIPAAPRRARKRRPLLRLAIAASVAAACLIALARVSGPDFSAPTILSLADPSSGPDRTAPLGTALPKVAALTLPPTDTATLPPLLATAAYGTDDLVERPTLPPSASEQVTARAVAMPTPIAASSPEKPEPQAAQAAPQAAAPSPIHAAAARKPAAKPVTVRTAAPRARGEAPRQETASRGPILDFLTNLIP